jgi:hypothetical protein
MEPPVPSPPVSGVEPPVPAPLPPPVDEPAPPMDDSPPITAPVPPPPGESPLSAPPQARKPRKPVQRRKGLLQRRDVISAMLGLSRHESQARARPRRHRTWTRRSVPCYRQQTATTSRSAALAEVERRVQDPCAAPLPVVVSAAMVVWMMIDVACHLDRPRPPELAAHVDVDAHLCGRGRVLLGHEHWTRNRRRREPSPLRGKPWRRERLGGKKLQTAQWLRDWRLHDS